MLVNILERSLDILIQRLPSNNGWVLTTRGFAGPGAGRRRRDDRG